MTITRHTLTARVPGFDLLPNVTGRITLDEGWSPYCQASLTLALPSDALLDALDPRSSTPPRVYLVASLAYGDGDTFADLTTQYGGLTFANLTTLYSGSTFADLTSEHTRPYNPFGTVVGQRRTFNLGVRSRRVDRQAAEVYVELASDEALLQDYALVSGSVVNPPSLTVRSAVETALSYANTGGSLTAGEGTAAIDADAAEWKPGVTAWDYVQPLVQQAGLRLWCDENRDWHLTTPTISSEGALSLSGTGTITKAEETISRDEGWWDAVVITYEWVDGTGATQYAYDTAGDVTATKVLSLTYKRPDPGTGAAAALLTRTSRRGRKFDTEAISNYEASPGQSVSLTETGVAIQSGAVSSIEWRFPDAEMTVGTRDLLEVPSTAWYLLPEGIPWSASPVGVSWTDTDPDPSEVL